MASLRSRPSLLSAVRTAGLNHHPSTHTLQPCSRHQSFTVTLRRRSFATDSGSAELRKTALYDEHVKLGGKMVPFAGYSLPVQYSDLTLVQSHMHTRQHASVFDVSHMGQLRIVGDKRAEFLETIVPSNILELKPQMSRLSSLLNPSGGILDDCMITNKGDYIYMVVNGACKEKDLDHMEQYLKEYNTKHKTDIRIEHHSDTHELLAFQGPEAAQVMAKLLPKSIDLSQMPFMANVDTSVAGIDGCYVARAGYTGEDGFEISVPATGVKQLFAALLEHSNVKPAGLGARDSLRLEAGLCLYGHDMTEDITPIEAGLKFTIQKRRREQGGFLGAETIQKQLKEGVQKQRVGFIVQKGPPAREGAEILLAESGDSIGTVSSGTQSPVLGKAIGMGYVSSKHAAEGTKIQLVVRGKKHDAEIVPMPFVGAKYFRVSK